MENIFIQWAWNVVPSFLVGYINVWLWMTGNSICFGVLPVVYLLLCIIQFDTVKFLSEFSLNFPLISQSKSLLHFTCKYSEEHTFLIYRSYSRTKLYIALAFFEFSTKSNKATKLFQDWQTDTWRLEFYRRWFFFKSFVKDDGKRAGSYCCYLRGCIILALNYSVDLKHLRKLNHIINIPHANKHSKHTMNEIVSSYDVNFSIKLFIH